MPASTANDHYAIWFGICAFAQLGAFVRLGFSQFKNFDSHQMSSVLYANFLGSMAIGALNTLKPTLQEKSLIPLFHAGSAGFCGTLTTFSTWQLEVTRWIIWWPNAAVKSTFPDDATWKHRMVTAASAMLVEVGVACLGFELGRALGYAATGYIQSTGMEQTDAEKNPESTPLMRDLRKKGTVRVTMTLVQDDIYAMGRCELFEEDDDSGYCPYQRYSFLGLFLCTTCVCLSCMLFYKSQFTTFLFFVVALAPLGALLRYYLGIWFNAKPKGMGTFLANFGACIIVGAIAIINVSHSCYESQPQLAGLLMAIPFGFCGALSTMSTFVSQLYEWEPTVVLPYATITILASQGALCIILSSYLSIHNVHSVCA